MTPLATRPIDTNPQLDQSSPTTSGARPLGYAATLLAGLEQVADGVVLLEPDPQVVTCARVVFTNPAFEKLNPNAPSPAVGQLLSALFPEACLNHDFVALLEAGQAARTESTCRAAGGSEERRTFELSLSPVCDPAGALSYWFGLVREVTVARRLARESSERERLAAVALLAAGMVHEINNPLASVTTNLEWLAATLPSLKPSAGATQAGSAISSVSAALVDALAGAERVETTIQHLGLLSGVEYSQRELLDVRLLLDAALHELEPQFSGGIQIRREYADMPHVFVSERRLKQAFVNLLANAAQAIAPESTERTVTVRTFAGERVRIEIEDSGSGVSSELARLLFHPFVTTKPMGVGKGLGLYLAKLIIETAGGQIGFSAVEPHGTMFWVELPRAEAPKPSPPKRVA